MKYNCPCNVSGSQFRQVHTHLPEIYARDMFRKTKINAVLKCVQHEASDKDMQLPIRILQISRHSLLLALTPLNTDEPY